MKVALYEEVLGIVQKTNILPIVSVCNIKCEFCSHKNNPEDIDVYTLPKLTTQQIEQMIQYLSPDRKIVIGDSASRIVEGEPFLHKDIMYILRLIRQKYKFTPIQITTNGSFFTENIVKELSQLEPIEINLSLNSSNADVRRKLIRDKKAEIAIQSCKLLEKYNIKYNGSLVAMPHITGWEDVENTIIYLCESGAEFIRVFIPGYTKYSDIKIDFETLHKEASLIVGEISENYDTPIVVEPPIIENLDAKIEGVIKDSAASLAGLKRGDVLTKVNDNSVACRVDAFHKVYKFKNPKIEYIREGRVYNASINKESNISPGFVVNYDISPDILHDIQNVIRRNRAQKPLVVSSELGIKPLKLLIEESIPNIKILAAVSKYFGGSIKVCGLLTIEDMTDTVKEFLQQDECDLIILPSVVFDIKGNDLRNAHYLEIEELLKIRVEIV